VEQLSYFIFHNKKGDSTMSIKDVFNEIASKYDKQRQLLIPCYNDFYTLPLETLSYNGETPAILDIGSGTGLFSSFILKKYPNAKITMIDLSDDMMKIAKERFESYTDFHYIVADYSDYTFNQKFDIIISSLSIHHLSHENKRKLYHKCYELLNCNGYFINADQVLSPSDYIESVNLNALHEFHKSSSLSQRDIEMAYERMKYDNPAPLFDQLQWLTDSGFAYVDCVYKYYQFCVLFAQK